MSQPAAVASASFARSSPRCQVCTSLPPFPSGFSRLWSGPATKPSSEIDMWQVVSDIATRLSVRWRQCRLDGERVRFLGLEGEDPARGHDVLTRVLESSEPVGRVA